MHAPTPVGLQRFADTRSKVRKLFHNSREVVGWTQTISSTTGQVLQRAFIYTGDTMYNLTFYLAGGPTVLLSDAYGIDCQGNIAATGVAASGGTQHNYLLVRQGTARTSCPL